MWHFSARYVERASLMARIALVAVLVGLADAFAPTQRIDVRRTALAGAKTDAVLGLLRRVPIVKRAVPRPKPEPVKHLPPVTVGRHCSSCSASRASVFH